MRATPDATGPETIIAFDFGLRRIGVAVGQTVTGSASPLGVVRNGGGGPDYEQISSLVAEWRPARLVVGMPLRADGSAGEIGARVLEFIEELRRYGLPIAAVDERHTSVEAESALKRARSEGSRGRISKEAIDSAAAVFIAERYLAGARAGVPLAGHET
jgi:putative Holliday junction resolvase